MNYLKKILLLIVLFNTFFIFGVDKDFGIFNYKGSRLKKIVRWYGDKREAVDQVVYEYDKNGFLKNRKMYGYGRFNKLIPIYLSNIEYDLDKKIIYERFNRYIRGKAIPPALLEYYYNNENLLFEYKRKDGNVNNDNIILSRDVEIQYNRNKDIIFIKDHNELSAHEMYFPGEGLGTEREMVFQYEYKDNVIIRKKELSNNFLKIKDELVFENKLLVKVIHYYSKEKGLISYIADIKYNDQNNIIETLYTNYSYKNPDKIKSTEKVLYDYDDKNRLVRRALFYSTDIGNGKARQVEEYTYEDGKYVHFPYLLPTTKIKLYKFIHNDVAIDKFMF